MIKVNLYVSETLSRPSVLDIKIMSNFVQLCRELVIVINLIKTIKLNIKYKNRYT